MKHPPPATKRSALTVLLCVANGTIAAWMIQAPKAGEACTVDPNYYYSGGKLVSYPYVSCRTLQDRIYSNVTGCPDNIRYGECFRQQVAVSQRNINWGVSQVRHRFPHWSQPAQAEPMILRATDTSRAATPAYRQTLPMDFAPAEVRQRSVTYSYVSPSRMNACRYDQRFC